MKKNEFSKNQMEEIIKGMNDGVDYKKYYDPSISSYSMSSIRKALIKGIDLTEYCDVTKYNYKTLWLMTKAIKKGINVTPFLEEYSAPSQINEIIKGLLSKIDITPMMNPAYSASQMRTIRHAISEGVDISEFSDPRYGDLAESIYKGVKAGLDITQYNDPEKDYYTQYHTYIRLYKENLYKKKMNKLSKYIEYDDIKEKIESVINNEDSYKKLMKAIKASKKLNLDTKELLILISTGVKPNVALKKIMQLTIDSNINKNMEGK